MTAIDGPRLRNLRAALAFLRLPPTGCGTASGRV